MKLFWSPRSPYVRKVMMVAHERGLAGQIETVPVHVAMEQASPEVMARNPLSKIPTLVLDDGSVLFDSRVIAEYLDGLGSGPSLFPQDRAARFRALGWLGLSEGLTDLLIIWRNERSRPPALQSAPHHQAYAAKRDAAFARLAGIVPELDRTAFGIGHIGAGIVCSYSDFRFPEYDWRNLHPALAEWHAAFSASPSAQATAPSLEG